MDWINTKTGEKVFVLICFVYLLMTHSTDQNNTLQVCSSDKSDYWLNLLSLHWGYDFLLFLLSQIVFTHNGNTAHDLLWKKTLGYITN